jgi:hypothetical protein
LAATQRFQVSDLGKSPLMIALITVKNTLKELMTSASTAASEAGVL